MEHYLNLGLRDAARNNNYTGNRDINEMGLTEMDLIEINQIAQQLEWDFLAGTDTTNVTRNPTYQQQTNQNIHRSASMEPSLSSRCNEHRISEEAFIEQPILGSPDTSTTVSFLETPPMPDYELPPDWAATWNFDNLDPMPELSNFSLEAALEWPIMGDLSAGSGLCLAPAWDGCSENGVLQYQLPIAPASSTTETASREAPTHSTASNPPSDTSTELFTCSFCPFTAASITKLKTHTNKHTRPFRCNAPSCTYATAEKKSLQRHVLAKARWDEEHHVAAEDLGVREVKYKCTGVGCDYVTIRDDNLRRHVMKCPAKVGTR